MRVPETAAVTTPLERIIIMTYRTTQKEIKSRFTSIIAVPYCGLQHLLNLKSPEAYTARREGWAADIYNIGGTAITTGYAPFGNIRPDYATVKAFDAKAEEIRYDYGKLKITYDEMLSKLDELLAEFVREVTK